MDLQGGSHSVNQVDGISDIAPAHWFCLGRTQQRDNGLCTCQCQCQTRQSLPVWCPSSYYPGAGAQREWIWVGKSMCGFSKRHFLGLQQPPPLAQSPLFLSHRLWGFTFLALESWAGGPGRGLGFLTPEISLLNCYPCGCGASLFCVCTPLTSLDGCGFLNSVVVRLPFSLISDVPEW